MWDDALNPMANDAGWPHIATDLRAENAKLCAKIERLRAALDDMVDMHDMDVTDGAIKMHQGSERWRRIEAARAVLSNQQTARCAVCGGHHNVGNPCPGP